MEDNKLVLAAACSPILALYEDHRALARKARFATPIHYQNIYLLRLRANTLFHDKTSDGGKQASAKFLKCSPLLIGTYCTIYSIDQFV